MSLEFEIHNRISSMLKGEKKYAGFYKDAEPTNSNNYTARFNPNFTNKSSSGSIGKGNITIPNTNSHSQSRTGPNFQGWGIY
jgi:hypothetical protein